MQMEEDKKRKSIEQSGLPLKKLLADQINTHEVAETEHEDADAKAIKEFQKVAIWKRMIEYKNKFLQLEQNYHNLKSREEAYITTLQEMHQFWNQMNNVLSIIFGRIEFVPSGDIIFGPSMEMLFNEIRAHFNSKFPNLKEKINECIEETQKTLDTTLTRLEMKLKEKPRDVDEACKVLQNTIDLQHAQMLKVAEKNSALNAQIISFENAIKELKSEKDNLEIKLDFAERKIMKFEVEGAIPVKKTGDAKIESVANVAHNSANGNFGVQNHLAVEELKLLKEQQELREKELEKYNEEIIQQKQEIEALKERLDTMEKMHSINTDKPVDEIPEIVQARKLKEALKESENHVARLLKEKNDLFYASAKEIMAKLQQELEKNREIDGRVMDAEKELLRERKEKDAISLELGKKNQTIADLQEFLPKYEGWYKICKDQLDIVVRENEKLRSEVDQAIQMNSSCGDEKIIEMSNLLNKLKEDEALLYSEIEDISKAFDKLQEQNTDLVKQVIEKDKIIAATIAEKLALEKEFSALSKENEFFSHRQMNLKKLETALIEENKKLTAATKDSIGRLMDMEKELTMRQNQSDVHKRKANENALLLGEMQQKLEALNTKNNELQEQLKEKIRESSKEAFSKKRITIYEKKLEIYEKSPEGAALELSKDLETYRKMLNCNSCNMRLKSVVLQRCMHSFCKECIDTRIETRQRKCPNCGEMFGTNDVRPFYL